MLAVGYNSCTMPRLSLYHYPSCFFCRKVRKALEQFKIEAELRDIHEDPQWRTDIMNARGRGTVPVLRIEGEDGQVQWMGESADIVKYLSTM